MDAAGVAIEHDAFVIGFFNQRESLPIGAETSELIEKFLLAELQVGRDGGNFIIFKSDITGPFAASSTTLTDVVGFLIEGNIAVSRAAMRRKFAHFICR